MLPYLGEHFANPSSAHRPGLLARRAIETAREQIAARLAVPPGDVVFTSGGTEANLAIGAPARAAIGPAACRDHRGRHPSVRQALADVALLGVDVTSVRPARNGLIDAAEIVAAVRPDTALVVMIHGQNEVGADGAGAGGRAAAARAGLARGATSVQVQSFGKVPLPLRDSGITSIALSARKVHGPKGVGAMVMRDRPQLWPLVSGGGQESGVRSGTENVAGIVGFGAAVGERMRPRPSAPCAALPRPRDRWARRGAGDAATTVGGWPATLPHPVLRAREHPGRGGAASSGARGHCSCRPARPATLKQQISHSALAQGLSKRRSVRWCVPRSACTRPRTVRGYLVAAVAATARALCPAQVS
ncbi:MAG: aminotransferase class V-fold PLP-dependent enzyme [Planctomycetota bacterium]